MCQGGTGRQYGKGLPRQPEPGISSSGKVMQEERLTSSTGAEKCSRKIRAVTVLLCSLFYCESFVCLHTG